ncbi:bifunctional DNA primase/polymerase, partial [Planktothrix agardhii]|uniref:bifunctional DNA primase/polymerase n=1 Tax=Planktothrix agardhii TaxID=1160 RepID=UPI002B1F28E9
MNNQHLINALNSLPDNLTLTPVFNKMPKIKNWQKGVSREIIIKEIQSGRANGIGLITGILSGHILAIDCDGPTAHELAEKLGGLPKTVSFTSGKKGRAQYLYLVPPEYREALKNFTRKVLETGTKGEQLELRYNSMQSVIPPSDHPETPGYISINSFEDTPIADSPTWAIEQILNVDSKPPNPDQLPINFNQLNQLIEPIPLIQLISVGYRANIKSGLGFECGRDDTGFKIACDLIAAEEWAKSNNINYSDSAKDLFLEYCNNCDSKDFTPKDHERIWKSASKSNPTPCLSSDKLENCYTAWLNKQGKKSSTRSSKSNYQTSGNTALKPEQQSNVIPFQQRQQETAKLPPIKETLKSLMERNLNSAELENEFLELSGIYPKYSKNAIESLYRKLSEESEK